MAHKDWCGKPCGECSDPCGLDESIPCGPDCENLNEDGSLKLSECISVKCDSIANFVYCDGELKDKENCEGYCSLYKECNKIRLEFIFQDAEKSIKIKELLTD